MEWTWCVILCAVSAVCIAAEDTSSNASNSTSSYSTEYDRSNSPNIVFILADDMGYGDVHYNGGNAETPNLDAMASGEHSIKLSRFYSGGPLCSPTRGTLLTGRNNNRYCIWEPALSVDGDDDAVPVPLPTSEITVAEILKEHNYSTAAFGKWHLGELDPCSVDASHPGLHGFDTWWTTEKSVATVNPNCGCFNGIRCKKQPKNCRNYQSVDPNTGCQQSWPEAIHGDDSLFLFRRFKEYLEEVVNNKEKFFIYLSFHTTHAPYVATDDRHDYYTQIRGFSSDEADYYGAVSGLDDAVGRVRDLLKSTGVSDNTMVWFASDNGPVRAFPGSTGGLRGGKGTLFEGGIRVPGIIEWPAVIQGNRKSDYPIVTSDLLPTVYDLLGVSPPDDRDIDGISILPMIAQESTERNQSILFMDGVYSEDVEDSMYFETDYQTVIMNDQYKLHVNYESGQQADVFLYDLVKDCEEEDDISQDNTEVVDTLKAEVEEWRQSVKKSAVEEVQCIN